MKVIVFGATGSVGRLAVERLLAEGHEVTAFARRIERLEIDHPRLTTVAGNAMEPQSVSNAVTGHDSVVVALGAGASRKSLIRSVGTRNIIEAMREQGVSRLICQTTLGAGESWENLNFFWKYVMFGLLLRPVFLDHERQEQLVRESGLDWTIVRPSALTDDPADGAFRVDVPASARGLSLKISRADVAAFLARCLGEPAFTHRAVGISH
jgi:uncharacterized protein YbjT (DUF2867 family)